MASLLSNASRGVMVALFAGARDNAHRLSTCVLIDAIWLLCYVRSVQSCAGCSDKPTWPDHTCSYAYELARARHRHSSWSVVLIVLRG